MEIDKNVSKDYGSTGQSPEMDGTQQGSLTYSDIEPKDSLTRSKHDDKQQESDSAKKHDTRKFTPQSSTETTKDVKYSRSQRVPGRVLWLVDVLSIILVIYPVMMCYWRGLWDLYGVYIFPDHPLAQSWTLVGVGCLSLCGYWLHPLLHTQLQTAPVIVREAVKRVYMCVYAVLPIAYWRGVWTVADYYLDRYGLVAALAGYVACELVLDVSRVRRMVQWPPITVSVDLEQHILIPTTRFSVKPGGTWRYFGDAIFSHFVALTFTILLWRSAWSCLTHVSLSRDIFVNELSYMALGCVLSISVLLLDPLFLAVHHTLRQYLTDRKSSARVTFLVPLLWEQFVYTVAFWSHAVLWYGAWGFNMRYMIADEAVGGWVNHIGGVIGFLLLQTCSITGSCGCLVDGNITTDADRFFDNKYWSILIQHLQDNQSCCYGAESTDREMICEQTDDGDDYDDDDDGSKRGDDVSQ